MDLELLISSLSPCEKGADGVEDSVNEAEEGSESPFEDHSATVMDDAITSDVVAVVGPGSCGIVCLNDSEDEEVDGANYRPNRVLNDSSFILKEKH